MKKIAIIPLILLLLTGCEPPPEQRPWLSVVPSPMAQTPEPTPPVTPAPTQEPTPEPTQEATPEPTPEPTEAPPKQTLLAKASTPLLDKGENRIANIENAANEISGLTLSPGETFSFNSIVGARSAANGYEKAPTIVKGKKQMEYGGGVCQLATTIYQAADKAGLAIIERHNHQKDVGYAEQGTDAAVNYGTLDMKFKNDTDAPIKIAVLVGKNTVNAEIYRINY